jgi:hypothetical protein
VLALPGTTASYFSIDGGVSPLAAFNNALPWVKPTQGDAADWAIGGQNDSFNAFTLPGVNGPMSATDFLVMNALGYATSGSVIGTGQGFAKAGDLDIFRTNAAGALSVLEFGNSGSLSLTQALSNADGTAFEVTDPNARVVGSGVDLWGSGERSIFVQTADHQLSAYEFNAAGTMGFWETIELRNGTPLQFDAGTSVVGLTSNLAGTGETDVILRGTAGAVSWLAFDGNGSAEAAPMNFLYSDGSAATVTADTRIAGSAHNVLGTGEQDLLLVSGTGQLLLWGLALGASNLTNMGIALPRVSLDAQVQGIGTNLLGLGGTDLQIRSGGGSVTWEISNQGSVLASA